MNCGTAFDSRSSVDSGGRKQPDGRVRWEPLLSADEERELAARIKGGDEAARSQLILSNLRLVIEIARRYRSSKVSLDDLVQEGNLGLIRASADFDPLAHGNRFVTYAEVWIRAFIHRALVANDSLIRLPEYVFLRRKRMRRLMNALGRAGVPGDGVDDAGLASVEEDGVSLDALDPAGPAFESDARSFAHEASEIVPLTELVADHRQPDQEVAEQERRLLLEVALRRLNPVEAWVLRERFGLGTPIPDEWDRPDRSAAAAPRKDRGPDASPADQNRAYYHRSYEDLERDCGLSHHRIVQVEQEAMKKLDIVLRPCLDPSTEPRQAAPLTEAVAGRGRRIRVS